MYVQTIEKGLEREALGAGNGLRAAVWGCIFAIRGSRSGVPHIYSRCRRDRGGADKGEFK
jgi:hypothetical protein